MKNIFIHAAVVLIPFVILTSCNYKQDKALELVSAPAAQAISDDQLNFKFVSDNVLRAKCLNCHSDAHGNKGGINLETYSNAFALIEKIRAEVAEKAMPLSPAPALTDYEMKLVITWIDSGAKEFATSLSQPASPPVVVVPEPTPLEENNPPMPEGAVFAAVMKQVIGPKCLKCHSGSAAFNFESFQNVVMFKDLIVQAVENGSMPMGDTLSNEQKNLIVGWVRAGALEK